MRAAALEWYASSQNGYGVVVVVCVWGVLGWREDGEGEEGGGGGGGTVGRRAYMTCLSMPHSRTQ